MPRAKKKPGKKKRPGKNGRPTKWKPEFIQQAEQLTLLGATDPEIAAFFKVSDKTLNTWKVTIPGFLQALKLGKDGPDNRVEASLFRRAMGYSVDTVKIVMVEGKPTKVPITEYYPPDTTACIFWLKNRRREVWRDVHRAEITTPPGQPMEVKSYVPAGTELLEDYYRRLEAAGVASGADPAAAADLGPAGQPGDGSEGDTPAGPGGPVLPAGEGAGPR